jgi:hypothetical protein
VIVAMPRGRILPPSALLLLGLSIPAAAHAVATSPPGVNLRWDQCYGDGGAWNKMFACNTNAGAEQLVGSFELDTPLDRVVTVDLTIDLRSASASMPAWWRMREFGTCRQNALALSDDAFPPTSTCPDWTPELTSSSISLYRVDDADPSHARLVATVALASIDAAHLDPGIEYFLFRVLLSHEKTVGGGSCGGCDVPVCLFLTRVSLQRQGDNVPAVHLDHGANGADSQYAKWQDGTTGPHPVCAAGTPVASHRSTWGAVKSLYR